MSAGWWLLAATLALFVGVNVELRRAFGMWPFPPTLWFNREQP